MKALAVHTIEMVDADKSTDKEKVFKTVKAGSMFELTDKEFKDLESSGAVRKPTKADQITAAIEADEGSEDEKPAEGKKPASEASPAARTKAKDKAATSSDTEI